MSVPRSTPVRVRIPASHILFATVQRASLKRPYSGKQPDLPAYDCPWRECSRRGQHAFTRRNDLDTHVRNVHAPQPESPAHSNVVPSIEDRRSHEESFAHGLGYPGKIHQRKHSADDAINPVSMAQNSPLVATNIANAQVRSVECQSKEQSAPVAFHRDRNHFSFCLHPERASQAQRKTVPAGVALLNRDLTAPVARDSEPLPAHAFDRQTTDGLDRNEQSLTSQDCDLNYLYTPSRQAQSDETIAGCMATRSRRGPKNPEDGESASTAVRSRSPPKIHPERLARIALFEGDVKDYLKHAQDADLGLSGCSSADHSTGSSSSMSDVWRNVQTLQSKLATLLKLTEPADGRSSPTFSIKSAELCTANEPDTPSQLTRPCSQTGRLTRGSRGTSRSIAQSKPYARGTDRFRRARSEPLLLANRPLVQLSSYDDATFRIAKTGAEINGTSYDQYGSTRSSTGKRPAHDDDQGDDGLSRSSNNGDSGNDGFGGKRRRLAGPGDDIFTKGRFPCIFHIGRPSDHKGDVRKYEYISQLLRHLKCHDFHACSKCFTRFPNEDAKREHDSQYPCVKACQNRTCEKHVLPGTAKPQPCICITSPEQKWRELYHLQYPLGDIPTDVFTTTTTITAQPNHPEVGLNYSVEELDQAFSVNLFPPPFAGVNQPPSAAGNGNDIDFAINTVPSISIDRSRTSSAPSHPDIRGEVQTLRQGIHILEQRVSQLSEREENLAMVLQFVWQEFTQQAQPSPAVWRLMRQHASDVMQTSTSTNAAGVRSRDVQDIPCPPPAAPSWSAADLGAFVSDGLLVPGPADTDSGYISTREGEWKHGP